MSDYWQNQTAPLYGAMRTIGAGIAQLPAMRSMAQQRAMMGQYYQERGQDALANADLARQKAQELLTETQEGNDFSDSAANYVKTFGDNTTKPEDRSAAAVDFTRKAGLLMAKDPDKFQTVADAIIQRMQANPTDLTQQFEANNPGKLVTGADALNDSQLAVAQAHKSAASGQPTSNQISTQLQSVIPNALKSVETATPPPQNPATVTTADPNGKPYPLTISSAIQSKLQDTAEQLADSGDPYPEIHARQIVLGTNATVQPNITTNSPAVPATMGTTMFGNPKVITPAVPANLSTNSFAVQPGGADQTVIAKLMQDPKLAAVVQGLGIAPADTSTATNAPAAQPASVPQIPPEHIAALLQHPDKAADFDQLYGQGAAARILNAKPVTQ